jgi:hypothetical protein
MKHEFEGYTEPNTESGMGESYLTCVNCGAEGTEDNRDGECEDEPVWAKGGMVEVPPCNCGGRYPHIITCPQSASHAFLQTWRR